MGEGFAETATSFPYIRVTDFKSFSVDTSDLRYLKSTTQSSIKRYTISKNDVYISIAGSVGVTGMIPVGLDGANLTENAAKLVLNQDAIDARFLMYYLASATAQREISGQTVKNAQPKLALARIASLKIPLPSLIEQRKIAAVLGLVQRAIELQDRLIALTTELKKALLHKLFTEGLRGEPQKQTEIGPVPESWEETTLGQLAVKPHGFLQTGPFGSQLHKHDYMSEGIGVVNPTHLWGNRINHVDVPRVSKETAERLERHRLEADDILFARRGEIGRHGLVTKDEDGWLCGTGCFLARLRHKHIYNRFLSYLFSTPGVIAWLNSHAAGAIMPNLNNAVLRSIPVFYPKLDVQVEIADCLDASEQKMINLARKKASFTDLFRTLLHQLMTAQIRVNDLDLSQLQCEMQI
jgi:type I restriction enzyme S subunit